MSDKPTTPILVTPKPWYQSRTLWFNFVLALVGLLVYVLTAIQTGQLQSPFDIQPDTLAFWVGLLNIIMRWITTQPIAGAGDE